MTDEEKKELEEEVKRIVRKNATYKSFRVFGDRLLVKVAKPPEKTASGLLYLPETSKERPPIVKILAKGPGKITKTVYKDHWYPGSKRWGKAGHEEPLAEGHGPETQEIKVGDFCLTIHPYLTSDKIIIDGEECHLIQAFEVSSVIQLEEGEDESAFNRIEMKRASAGG